MERLVILAIHYVFQKIIPQKYICFSFFLKFLMIKHDHVWEKWTPDLASKLKLSIDFRSENGSDEFWVRWHTMLWFSTCPSPFPIGVYDTDKHYTTNQSWGQNHNGIVFEFGDIKGLSLFFTCFVSIKTV